MEEKNVVNVYLDNAAAPDAEKYTRLWILLINQMEGEKQILSTGRKDTRDHA